MRLAGLSSTTSMSTLAASGIEPHHDDRRGKFCNGFHALEINAHTGRFCASRAQLGTGDGKKTATEAPISGAILLARVPCCEDCDRLRRFCRLRYRRVFPALS